MNYMLIIPRDSFLVFKICFSVLPSEVLAADPQTDRQYASFLHLTKTSQAKSQCSRCTLQVLKCILTSFVKFSPCTGRPDALTILERHTAGTCSDSLTYHAAECIVRLRI